MRFFIAAILALFFVAHVSQAVVITRYRKRAMMQPQLSKSRDPSISKFLKNIQNWIDDSSEAQNHRLKIIPKLTKAYKLTAQS